MDKEAFRSWHGVLGIPAPAHKGVCVHGCMCKGVCVHTWGSFGAAKAA